MLFMETISLFCGSLLYKDFSLCELGRNVTSLVSLFIFPSYNKESLCFFFHSSFLYVNAWSNLKPACPKNLDILAIFSEGTWHVMQ